MDAKSVIGKGTTFTIRLPLEMSGKKMTTPNNSFKILIVDDEFHVRQSFCDYFEDHDWQVLAAESGESALSLLEKQSCIAAIVDIRMGGMDGETFIRQANIKYPEMIFVICTGSPEYKPSEDIQQKSCVADQVFAKPVTHIGELEKTVISLLPMEK